MDAPGEDGWTAAGFHTQVGSADWRITSWGPQAFFRAGSLAEAAVIVPAILEAAAGEGLEPDVDLRTEGVVVRIPYRGAHRVDARAPRLASAISAAASEAGLVADPRMIQTVDIAVAQHPDTDTRAFWAATLGYAEVGDTDAADPLRRGPSLSFMPIDGIGERRGRTHIDVSVPADLAETRVAAALAAGGRLVDDTHAPAWWTVASPDNHGIDIAAWTDTWD